MRGTKVHGHGLYWLNPRRALRPIRRTALILLAKMGRGRGTYRTTRFQVARGETVHPRCDKRWEQVRTALVCRCENIFARKQELERRCGRNLAQTIGARLPDGLLVVDARSRIMLMNQRLKNYSSARPSRGRSFAEGRPARHA